VTVIPGMLRSFRDPGKLAAEAGRIGYPLIIKAAAGGGGKGMHIVRSEAELEEAAARSSSEAKKAFGDASIYLEKYLEKPRHVEFQILADGQGNMVHLHERECSVQRRYQKIIEESPSPFLTEELRSRMSEAALAVARAAGYVSAGTVEFLVDSGGRFYFLEMNTRIQVEHTITEMRTGIDLVRKQIEIAEGGKLDLVQDDVRPSGHAVECRVYAEDPENRFYPSPGRILYLREPAGSGVRVDSGIYEGADVPVEYDPILSKVMVRSASRSEAVDRMVRALREYVVLGVKTTIPFMIDVLDSERFRAGETTTDLIDSSFAGWSPDAGSNDLAAIAYILHDMTALPQAAGEGRPEESFKTPWQRLGQWRIGKP
jgi:acetyl/propionyl-CoA carboxylase alpha subunit